MRSIFAKSLIIAMAIWLSLGAVTVQAAPQPQEHIHVVQRGETLSYIALRYGTSVEALARANGIADLDLIFVGQRLTIPTISHITGQIHIVQRGETLLSIASRYGTSVEVLAQANGIADLNLIYEAQQLIVSSSLPFPFTSVEVTPSPAVQGQTLVIKVRMDEEEAALEGSLDGRLLTFVEGEGYRWALAGIHALAQPGLHFLELEADGAEATRAVQVVAGEFPVEYIRFSPGVSKLLDPAILEEEKERMAEVFAVFSPERRWEGLFAVPVQGRISSPFGAQRSYNGGPVSSYHGGVDYGASVGTPVHAAEAGRVVLAEELKVRGKAVVIDHGLGVMSGYWHLSDIAVRAGQEVEKGDLIGEVGNTGLSTGPHLHWEVQVDGVKVNPLQWTRQKMP